MRLLLPTLALILQFLYIDNLYGTMITPDFIRSLPPLPTDAAVELAKHENFPLATGKVDIVTVTKNNDIGYGVTPSEIKDAKEEGFLPQGYKFPRRMTKAQADTWYWTITLPTYRSIVRKTVKVPLTLEQEAALVFFAFNVGKNHFKTAVDKPGRLNDGNYKSIEEVMPLYYEKERPEKAGLQKRLRFMLAVYKGEPFPRKG